MYARHLSHLMVMSHLSLQVVNKLHQASQQSFQLAIQQAFAIGEFLSQCMHQYQANREKLKKLSAVVVTQDLTHCSINLMV